jgi:hypothetical protein
MDFEVNRTDFRQTRLVEAAPVDLASGQIRLAVERFAFTANNISYAVAGDMLDYWGFFPCASPWGRLPAMGFGSVSESAHPEIQVGGRYFGFYPMSDEVVIDARPSRTGFSDVGSHRANHAGTYVRFTDVSGDPFFREDRGDEYLLLRGLFTTSFLVDDFLDDHNFYGAEQTLVTSASSKTSIALATCLAARGHRSVGLTSAGNRGFVERLGLYDQVATYDDIETLDATTPSVVVDMAGDGRVQSRIHHHFTDGLRYASQVGATHWEDLDPGGAELPGPRPEFFFAPGQIAKRSEEWGPTELDARIGRALADFLETAPQWLTVQHSAGPESVTAVYLELLEGRADASVGHILSLSPTAFPD